MTHNLDIYSSDIFFVCPKVTRVLSEGSATSNIYDIKVYILQILCFLHLLGFQPIFLSEGSAVQIFLIDISSQNKTLKRLQSRLRSSPTPEMAALSFLKKKGKQVQCFCN